MRSNIAPGEALPDYELRGWDKRRPEEIAGGRKRAAR